MAILGNLIRKGIIFSKSLEQQFTNPAELQKHELRKLLIAASETEYGKQHHFKSIISDFRKHALKEISITLLPNTVFYDFLKAEGMDGGQHKFPRVLKGGKKETWENFLETIKLKHD